MISRNFFSIHLPQCIVFKPGAAAGARLYFEIVPVRTSVDYVCLCVCMCVSTPEAINNLWRDMDPIRLVKQVL